MEQIYDLIVRESVCVPSIDANANMKFFPPKLRKMIKSIDYGLLTAFSLALVTMSIATVALMTVIWRFCFWDDAIGKIEDLEGVDHVDEWARPVVAYEYKNIKYRSVHRRSQHRGGYSAGEIIDICVNPKNPNDYVIMDWAGPIFGLISCGTFVVVLIRDIARLLIGQ